MAKQESITMGSILFVIVGKGRKNEMTDLKIYDDADIRLIHNEVCDAIVNCIRAVENMPATDVKPVRRWIPVEERLPENGVYVLVWYEYFRFGNYNRPYQTYDVGYHYDGYWSMNGHQVRCIAWQPLPKPYTEGSDK